MRPDLEKAREEIVDQIIRMHKIRRCDCDDCITSVIVLQEAIDIALQKSMELEHEDYLTQEEISARLDSLDWMQILSNAIGNKPKSWANGKEAVREWRNASDTILFAVRKAMIEDGLLEDSWERAREFINNKTIEQAQKELLDELEKIGEGKISGRKIYSWNTEEIGEFITQKRKEMELE